MTARLPTVAGDNNAWGSVLNDFLSVSHNADGTLSKRPINLKDTCAIDGVTDDSTHFTAAYAAAAAAGVGLYMPGGTLIKGNDTLLPNVSIDLGGGTIKLKNGANADLFSANTGNINLAGTAGTGSATGTNFWTIKNGKLDGNKANQSAGPSYCIRAYGYGHVLEHMEIVGGFSGGILLDWNNTANPTPPGNAFMPRWYDVMVHDCNGIGIQIGGPTDMQWTGVNGFNSGSHVVHLAPNCVALKMVDCHFWGTPISVGAVTLLCEAPQLNMSSCQIEGSDVCALVLLSNDNQGSNLEVGTVDALRAGRGIQLGQPAGGTPIPGQIFQSAGARTAAASNLNRLSGKTFGCVAGALDEQNTGSNVYDLMVYQTSGTGIVGGYPAASSSGRMGVSGLTPDGSPGKGGFFQIGNASFYGMQAYNSSGVVLFSLDTFDSVFQLKNGFPFTGYSDNGTTLKYNFDASTGNIQSKGNLAVGQSATTPDPGAGGTITTANIGLARVTPAASRTGVILQAGTVAGQKCTVVNNSASFTITFATAATSNVAQGVSLVIAALGKYDFTWDSVAARWY